MSNTVSPFVSPPELKLKFFKGPFDLLYQLLQKGEIPWGELPLSEVAENFAGFEEVNEKSAFLSHFVHLAWLKAGSFFPKEEQASLEMTFTSIAEVIASYQTATLLRKALEEQESISSLIYRREPLPEEKPKLGLKGVHFEELQHLFTKLLLKHDVVLSLPEKTELTLQEILDILLQKLPLSFEQLFLEAPRKEWIPLFLALLEGLKQEKISLLEEGMLWKKL